MSTQPPEPPLGPWFQGSDSSPAYAGHANGPILASQVRQPVETVGGPWQTVGWLWATESGTDGAGFIPNVPAGDAGLYAAVEYLRQLDEYAGRLLPAKALWRITWRGGNGCTVAYGRPVRMEGGLEELRRQAGHPPSKPPEDLLG